MPYRIDTLADLIKFPLRQSLQILSLGLQSFPNRMFFDRNNDFHVEYMNGTQVAHQEEAIKVLVPEIEFNEPLGVFLIQGG